MRRRSLPLLLVVAVLAAACSESDLVLRDDRLVRPEPEIPAGEVLTDPDDVTELALEDLRTYWSRTMVEVYDIEFRPLAGGYVPYGPRSPLPACGPDPVTYDQIAENALYCPAEDLIAWDRENLIPALQERFGSLTVGLVMAHEFAHAVQARAGVRGATVTLELQADCFAGAWVDDVDDRIPTFHTGADALDSAVGGLLELRDSLGVPGYATTAHGSGFDRVSAFQQGYEEGPAACATYADEPPAVVAIPFGSPTDQATGGNLPLDELLEPLVADLESFYAALFAEQDEVWDPVDGFEVIDPADGALACGDEEISGGELELAAFYCVADDTAYMDGEDLIPALAEIGDFAFGGELARIYAFAAQDQLGIDPTDEVVAGLHADCLTGTFAAAEFRRTIPEQRLVLSPGDLDEIIIAFLTFGGEAEASAFERTAAFRAGFVDGADPCRALVD
ncbi:neutral zinc metallopeptidase [Acidimicrobiia bacterium EGI L10123]|uniref:neutral zinc metallopeptidase n=1 Tax=Salinilacustrithrix flava TaxID=2957203 RepID=UPI003D7C237C|nr:neutral zinc metallopeptidase [Acidimicrobiia bacterium EGI L10123]